MAGNPTIITWTALALTTLSAFHGFELAWGASSIGGDIFCLSGAVVVALMAQRSRSIFSPVESNPFVMKALCCAALLIGPCHSFVGIYSLFSPDLNPGGYLENNFWTAFLTALKSGKAMGLGF